MAPRAKHPSKASMGQHKELALIDRKGRREPLPKGSACTTVWQPCLEPRAAAGRAEPSRTCHLLLWEITAELQLLVLKSSVDIPAQGKQ